MAHTQRPPPEQRTDERAAVKLRVDYKRLNSFFADYTKNISKGGTFIRTTKPLPIGTEFMFVLSFPAQDPAAPEPQNLELTGQVKWIVDEGEATEEKPAGMGIRFKFNTDAERKAVADFVEKLMRDVLGDHISAKLLAASESEKD